jgi:hypothetical protein
MSMKETAVHEDGNAPSWEDQVGFAGQTFVMQQISKSGSV